MDLIKRIEFTTSKQDFWIGIHIDHKEQYVYFLPLPMLGIKFYYGEMPSYCAYCGKPLNNDYIYVQDLDGESYKVHNKCVSKWTDEVLYDR